ncbi:hypothetical protein JQ608_06650 [Bradyrhizobium liaoningense]|uniref:hypothetical protein n=1 Tax=Bradyrhizobium liaoningense TaxID=43992 RepID=UPI001BA5C46D|nr:hypothetical protein [Bradyrhizobium liaoningense]MBR0876880.1 hypothetical protein [Bradyrhizobium liaoningense]
MIAAGHRPEDAWSYTPKQLTAWIFIAEQRRKVDRAEFINSTMMASRGDAKEVQKHLKELVS